jgi:PPOX class probable F420-dependent enzyme
MAEIPAEVRALLESPNFVHVATLLPDGTPHTVPVWAKLEGDRIAFFTQPVSQKAKNLARDPRVAISVTDHENPYRMANLRGRVTETLEGDAARTIIDRISQSYTGEDFPMPGGIVFLVDVEKARSMELPFTHEPPA